MTSQKEIIQNILNKDKKSSGISEISHFTPEEKCTAIYNWKRNSEVEFDLSFVESVHDYYLKWGKCSDKQIYALDRIIKKFKIDIERWCL